MKKHCTNPSCATKGIEVETKAERCISCTRLLISTQDFHSLLGGLFGERG